MSAWLASQKRGLSRTLPDGRITGPLRYHGARASLRTLQPYVARHWRTVVQCAQVCDLVLPVKRLWFIGFRSALGRW